VWEARAQQQQAPKLDSVPAFPSLRPVATPCTGLVQGKAVKSGRRPEAQQQPPPSSGVKTVTSTTTATTLPTDQLPECWEDLEVPDTWESLDTRSSMAASAEPAPLSREECRAGAKAPADAPGRPARGSGHSRLRKDLVNLDKAAAKWVRQERDGSMTLGELVDRVRRSPAAQHLRAAHGVGFREEAFVQEVLGRATAGAA
jgi:hypothetical protein